MLAGCSLSPGYGSGTVLVYHSGFAAGAEARAVHPTDVADEQLRFRTAVAAARREVAEIRECVMTEIGEAESDIIGAHLLLLEDPGLVARVERRIEAEGVNAEHALQLETDAIASRIRDSKSDVLRERALDVTDVSNRLLKHLGHGSEQILEHLPPATVIVARELLPSDTLKLDRTHVAGIVLERGAPHSHVAILARAMGIPAVGGIDGILDRVGNGDRILVDGERGEVLIAPDASQTDEFTRSWGSYDRDLSQLAGEERKRCVTLDEQEVTLLANIGRPSEVEQVQGHHLCGIGLFRTEYLFLESSEQPSVDSQRDTYRTVIERLSGKPFTIRTFDFGADKRPQFMTGPMSRGQSLGLRGLRLSLQEDSMLRGQIRAIIEATAPGEEIALLLPMVVSAEDLEIALELIEQIASSLGRRRPRVGAMIETPSAVFEIDEILRLADFASVGTNDLTQFMLGAERRSVGSLDDEAIFQPAMLRALRHIAERGFALNRSITVCGEAAGDPLAALMLIGLGFRSLSMSPVRAVRVRSAIRRHRASALAELASQALGLSSRAQVTRHVRRALDETSRSEGRVLPAALGVFPTKRPT